MELTKNNSNPQKNPKINWILKGFILGSASLLPGVSVGTLALIMGIYEKCIFSITNLISFSKKTKDDMAFLLFLTIGFLGAIFLLTKVISQLLTYFPLEVYSIFTGLIVASLPKLFKLTNKNIRAILGIFLTAVGVFLLFKMIPSTSHNSHSFLRVFISGFLGFFASILPGLSGSMVLLLLDTYHFILKALTAGLTKYILIFLTGGGLGLICAFYFTRFFLKKQKNLFFCIAIGCIIGSLPEVTYEKWISSEKSLATLNFIICIFLGAGLFFLAEKISSFPKKTP